ncbi:MAG: OmpA family protein [Bacteroidia bacterium]
MVAKKKIPRLKNIFFVFFILFCSLVQGAEGAFAQMESAVKKADAYYNNNEYIKAIPLYKRASAKNDAALRKLADCYRIIKNYSQAELYYGKLAAKKPVDPTVYYYYGEALLNDNKYDEAKQQFVIYSTLNSDDNKGELYAKACDEIKELLVKPALYKVYNLGDINSTVSDFCPVIYKDGLVFASERVRDLVNYSKNGWTGNSYLSLLYAKGEKRPARHQNESTTAGGKDSVMYENTKLFSNKFNGGGHYGPACFSNDFSELFLTKVDNTVTLKRGTVSQSKIYCSKYSGGWSPPKALPFSSNDYATGHPSVSKDGQSLYFTSNMPGGRGGTDIWVSKREGDTWGAPQNLGSEINTAGDENFPYIGSSNILYFSSNGHPGFGGLDLFASIMKDGKWSKATNMMPPINSTGDDFGIIFKDDNSGYFSSNRAGGKGSDDLYGFSLSGLFTSVSGKILLSRSLTDGAPNVMVYLLTDKGTIIQSTSTDASGFFRFENLPADQSYMIKVDENDPGFVNQKKFYLTDAKSKLVRVAVKSKEGIFIFENLPADLTKLSQLVEDDVTMKSFSIAGNLYAGEQRAPIDNTKVNLVNDKGEVVQSTTTNAFGSFVFVNITPDQNFTITLDAADPKLVSSKIYFTNKSGKEVGMSPGGAFKFQVLASDKNTLSLLTVEDSQLLVDLKGTLYSDKEGKSRIANSVIKLMDKNGKTISTTETDASGNFKFVNLPADQNYLVRLQEDDPHLSLKDIFLADSRGRIVATMKSKSGKFFRYEFLPTEERSLAHIYFDDPWLKVAKMQSETRKDSLMTIIENIYFDYQKSDLLPQAIITLNKVINVMRASPDISIDIIAHTDSRGSGEFNMKLSQKRAQVAVDYIISKGIDKKRLAAIGKGETEPVNRCKDGVDCSEDEHAQNRRTEFKVKKSGK